MSQYRSTISNDGDTFLHNIDTTIDYIEIKNKSDLNNKVDYTLNKHKKVVHCGNCGKKGHIYKKCHFPVMSMGFICIKLDNIRLNTVIRNNTINENSINDRVIDDYLKKHLKFLMIRRKHSLGYVEFIRGKYELDDVDYLLNIVSLMSSKEIDDIKTLEFNDLWNDLWNIQAPNKNHKNEYDVSYQKFIELKKGVVIKFQKKIKFKLNLVDILDNVTTNWTEPEWGFPKGRRNLRESDLDCAIREFNEETNFNSSEYEIIDLKPITEKFIGTNGVRYQHTYYLSQVNYDIEPQLDESNMNQMSEIGDMDWFGYDESLSLIRNYNIDKKIKLDNIYYLIKLLLLNSNYTADFFTEK